MKAVWSVLAGSLVLGFLALPATTAQEEKSVRPGINKPFEKPDLEDFRKKFEGESREVAALTREIVAACKIKPGMTVADVGAGTGLFTRKFAAAVGDNGKVFAVDIAPTFLRHIEKTCEADKLKQVETILCDQFSTRLPKNSVDLVFICDTYHHFEFPQRTLQSIHDALRPGGRIVLIDFHRIEGKSSKFILGHVRAGQEVFVREIKSAGFQVIGEEKLLKENYFVHFEKVKQEKPLPIKPLPKACEDLVGVWTGYAVEGKGEKPNQGPVKLELTISKDRIQARQFKGKNVLDLGEGTLEIQLDQSPNRLDGNKKLDNPNRKEIWLGIYQQDGDTLKWCVGRKARPTEFETKQGAFLLILQRKNP